MKDLSPQPRDVKIAARLLYAACGVIALETIAVFVHLRRETPVFIVILPLAFLWLVFKISAGANWARIATLVFFLMDAPFAPSHVYSFEPDTSGNRMVAFGLEGAALVLLFTSDSAKYFDRVNGRSDSERRDASRAEAAE